MVFILFFTHHQNPCLKKYLEKDSLVRNTGKYLIAVLFCLLYSEQVKVSQVHGKDFHYLYQFSLSACKLALD